MSIKVLTENMSDTPLFNAVLKYSKQNTIRCHTPGHSGKAEVLFPFSQILPYDLTEISGLDSLYEAEGVISEAEAKTAELFGCNATLFSSGGCTLAIQTMLSLVAPSGGRVAMGRNLHRSAVNTSALLNIEPVWLYPNGGVVTVDEVKKAVLKYSDLKAVYLTSPDYYGRLCDIKAISAICKTAGVPLVVDNAHGAHLKFFENSLHPLDLGADMTACSAHKTLPVLTGGAWLNISDEKYIKDAKLKMSLFGSTSPSYITMSSLDLCRQWLATNGKAEFEQLKSNVSVLKQTSGKFDMALTHDLCDPIRLTLDTGNIGIDGTCAADFLRENAVEPEYADQKYVVLILTPFHSKAELEKINDLIIRLAGKSEKHTAHFAELPLPKPQTVMSLRKAMFSEFESLDINKALGRTAAKPVCPCPPGIPAVIPGEKIDLDVIEYLKHYKFTNIDVVL